MRMYDAILIPGGGVRGKGDLPIWVKRRLEEIKLTRGPI